MEKRVPKEDEGIQKKKTQKIKFFLRKKEDHKDIRTTVNQVSIHD